MSEKILIVDDEKDIADLLEVYLKNENYTIHKYYSAREALAFIENEEANLAILDIMLPDINGFTLCQKIREKYTYPVIMLTAKDEETDKITGLTLGADDYITKPFDTRELLARIAVWLRASFPAPLSPTLHCGDLTLDTAARSVSVSGTPVKLTRTEYAILKLLMQNPMQAISKSAMLDRISEDTPDCTESSLKTHVSNLRKKLRDAGAGDCIESVWGIGFKMRT